MFKVLLQSDDTLNISHWAQMLCIEQTGSSGRPLLLTAGRALISLSHQLDVRLGRLQTAASCPLKDIFLTDPAISQKHLDVDFVLTLCFTHCNIPVCVPVYLQSYSMAVYLVKQQSSTVLLQRLRAKGIRNPDHSRALSKPSEPR